MTKLNCAKPKAFVLDILIVFTVLSLFLRPLMALTIQQ